MPIDPFKAAPNVSASFTSSGGTTTYVFSSLVDEDPVRGVPGLVGYCVYTTPNPDALALNPSIKGWTTTNKALGYFSFVRANGDKSNIPLDGKTTQVGTATWNGGTAPADQTILLHILDAEVCNDLYGGNVDTCWVKPYAPICDLGPPDLTNIVYTAIPRDAVNCGPPSHAFEGTSTREFGDEVVLEGGGTLQSLTVLFNSYACSVNPAWNNPGCVSTAGATFTHPITARIYLPTDLTNPIATASDTFTIPYRPSADNVRCTGAFAGGWFNTYTQRCEFSAKTLLTFTFAPGVTLTDGERLVWTVAFNTSDYGATPLRPQPCNSTLVGCPYDSLNVGTKSYEGAPFVGAAFDPYGAFINSTWPGIYCDNGAGGTGFLRLSTTPPACTNTTSPNYSANAWFDLRPLGEIKVAP